MKKDCRTFLFIWSAGRMRPLDVRIARDRFAFDRIVLK